MSDANKLIVDMNRAPVIPSGWKLKSHQQQGLLEYDPEKIEIYLSREQKGQNRMLGHKLKEEIETHSILEAFNANLLDHWLLYPSLIPGSLQGKATFFWNTIYFHPRSDDLGVRYLYRDGKSWRSSYDLLDNLFSESHVAAMYKKTQVS